MTILRKFCAVKTRSRKRNVNEIYRADNIGCNKFEPPGFSEKLEVEHCGSFVATKKVMATDESKEPPKARFVWQ